MQVLSMMPSQHLQSEEEIGRIAREARVPVMTGQGQGIDGLAGAPLPPPPPQPSFPRHVRRSTPADHDGAPGRSAAWQQQLESRPACGTQARKQHARPQERRLVPAQQRSPLEALHGETTPPHTDHCALSAGAAVAGWESTCVGAAAKAANHLGGCSLRMLLERGGVWGVLQTR